MKFLCTKISIISVFCVTGFLCTWVFAQTTPAPECSNICNVAAPEFTLMLDLARDLINSIKTQWTAGDYIGKYVDPNWFEGNIFNPPQQSIKDKVITNLSQKLNFVAATTAIFTSPQQWWGLKDLFAGIIILFKNKVFFRDLQAVQTIDALLTQKKYELGMWWGWYAEVSDANLQVFQKVLDTYKVKGLLTWSNSIDWILYSEMADFIARLLSTMKTFVSTNATSQFTAQRLWGQSISISFDPVVIQRMQSQYDCARGIGNICDKTFKDFGENMKKLGSASIASVKASMKIFKDAGKRLVETFQKNPSSEFQAREKQLLKSYYGNAKIKSGWSILSAKIDAGWFFSQWRSAEIENKSKDTSTITQVANQQDASSTATVIAPATTFASAMKAGMLPFVDDQARDLSLVNFADTRDFSAYFKGLGEQIAVTKSILWDKEKNGTIIKELGTACELQCGWINKKCWK